MRRYRFRCQQRMSALLTSDGEFSLLPTPAASSYGNNQGGGAGRVGPVRPSLESMAKQGLLPTPTVGDAKSSGSRQKKGSKAKPGVSLTDVVVHRRTINEKHGDRLPTPSTRDYKGSPGKGTKGGRSLPRSLGQTTRSLNPRFVTWMMGFPLPWFDSAISTESKSSWRSGTRFVRSKRK